MQRVTDALSSVAMLSRYEKEHGLPFEYLNVAITAQGHGGAFQVSSSYTSRPFCLRHTCLLTAQPSSLRYDSNSNEANWICTHSTVGSERS